MKKLGLLLKTGIAAGLIALADNGVKDNIERNVSVGETFELINHGVTIHRHHNKGLPMNIADKHQKEVAAVSSAALTVEMLYAGLKILNNGTPLTALAHSLIIGGALSNTADRVLKGYVVDYLSFKKGKAIYNISDFAIMAGAALVVLDELFTKE